MNRSVAALVRPVPLLARGGLVAAVRDDARFVVLATGVALGLRVLYYLWGGPIRFNDTATYLQAGLELLGAGRMESDLAMPLYPLFMAIAGWRGVVWVQL